LITQAERAKSPFHDINYMSVIIALISTAATITTTTSAIVGGSVM